ncbi:putative integral membrane protein conserved region-domain-containing protein [Phyllosticta citriasiana]|uniref:Integral membrane protein conserved region-domain-containing protein n=1 Tax=Phyllosticta citriasiana TaxID=595635 RepID=A0ABR1KJ95_9PEZI
MTSATTYLLVYLSGGLTFLPLCAVIVLSYVVFTSQRKETDCDLVFPQEDPSRVTTCEETSRDVPHDESQLTEPNFVAGYFAVCREYTPGVMNGKPSERTPSNRPNSGPESLSVYQSMYRSFLNRNKTQGSSMGANTATSRARASSNFFYVVLRHGRLILFDDSDEIEVRHVISLADRAIDIYAGGHAVPEGELWIKRNCIRLRPINPDAELQSESQSFYFFSDNCSAKEDFYFALLRNQGYHEGQSGIAPIGFDQSHMIKLVQQLHSSEDNLQTRWANAVVGRLFLAMYRTSIVENFIREKITKKIGRVAKPAFIQSISIRSIDMGDSAPLVKNPRLRELKLDGDLTAEADVTYCGNFRLDIMAVARIDLGARIKPRYVNMVLASILKKLEGHVLVRIKPPPSNRLWMTFENPPKLEMVIEPIVSSRQITYGVILRAIENRIREVIAETLVMPNWDDLPFHDTCFERVRGGLWRSAESSHPEEVPSNSMSNSKDDKLPDIQKDTRKDSETDFVRSQEKTMSMPNLGHALRNHGTPQKMTRTMSVMSSKSEARVHGGVDPRNSPTKPKSMRSGSFSSIAQPVVNTVMATVDSQQTPPSQPQHEAFSAVKDLSSLSQSPYTFSTSNECVSNPDPTPDFDEEDTLPDRFKSNVPNSEEERQPRGAESFPRESASARGVETNIGLTPPHFSLSGSSTPSNFDSERALPTKKSPFSEKRLMLNASFNTAATAAKKWISARHASVGNTQSLPSELGSSPESFSSKDLSGHDESEDQTETGLNFDDFASVSGIPTIRERRSSIDEIDAESLASLSSSADPVVHRSQSTLIKRKKVPSNASSSNDKGEEG